MNEVQYWIMGSVYVICSVVGILLSFYLLLHTAQKHFNWTNVVAAGCAFCNLIGFATSPTLIATSLLSSFPLARSITELKVGDLGLTLGFFLFSLNFTLRHYKERRKEATLLYLFLATANSLETCTIITGSRVTHLVAMVATFTGILLNMVVSLLTTRDAGILTYSKLSDVTASTDDVIKRGSIKRQGALICLILATLMVLPKVTYDGLELASSTKEDNMGQEYFERNAFLISRSLLYMGAFVQIICHTKLFAT